MSDNNKAKPVILGQALPQVTRPSQTGQNSETGSKTDTPVAQQPKSKDDNGAATIVSLRPMAAAAKMRIRHWGVFLSFLIIVVLPVFMVFFYLSVIAKDQYASTTGFTVRQEESTGATELLGGLASFTGTSVSSDTDMLYEFIQSQELVQLVNEDVGLIEHYSSEWPYDPVFALSDNATTEDLLNYWRRVVRISYDQSTGLIELRVLAFDREKAQQIAQAILSQSQNMINALNVSAREDAMRYAQADLVTALDRLKSAREALTSFRTRTQIVDPQADLQGRLGVMNNLQQKLAEALIDYDLLLGSTTSSDPRLSQVQRRIDVIRQRIAEERNTFTSNSTATGAVGTDYPSLIAEYESLVVDREYAEETYRAALSALDIARADASRQSRYLAAYIRPTVAQSSEFPQSGVLLGLTVLFLVLAWSIMALIYYSIRDRR
nr:sugar transporter [Sulfitobacter algicola]